MLPLEPATIRSREPPEIVKIRRKPIRGLGTKAASLSQTDQLVARIIRLRPAIEKTLFSLLLIAENGVQLCLPDADLDQAIAELAPGMAEKLFAQGDEKLSQRLSIEDDSTGLGSSPDNSTEGRPRKRKAQEIPGFDAVCRLLARDGFPLRMAEAGLEPAQGLLPEGF